MGFKDRYMRYIEFENRINKWSTTWFINKLVRDYFFKKYGIDIDNDTFDLERVISKIDQSDREEIRLILSKAKPNKIILNQNFKK